MLRGWGFRRNLDSAIEIATLGTMKAVEWLQRGVRGEADLEIVPAYPLQVARSAGRTLLGAVVAAGLTTAEQEGALFS